MVVSWDWMDIVLEATICKLMVESKHYFCYFRLIKWKHPLMVDNWIFQLIQELSLDTEGKFLNEEDESDKAFWYTL